MKKAVLINGEKTLKHFYYKAIVNTPIAVNLFGKLHGLYGSLQKQRIRNVL